MLQVAKKLLWSFGGLRVRYKLMILHNLFFLVLAASVWLTLIPLIEDNSAASRDREIELLRQALLSPRRLPQRSALRAYDYHEGAAAELRLDPALRRALDARPGEIIADPQRPHLIYLKDPTARTYRTLRLPLQFYDSVLRKSKTILFAVLAAIYCVAVCTLEFFLMPQFIYRPLRRLLDADAASRRGDAKAELIDDSLIREDELGQLMASRNATLRELRARQTELKSALGQVEAHAADLKKKNYLLERAKRNIADQDRLASLGLLSASVAHELNTPLAVLFGSIEKLLETSDNEQKRDRLERMLRVTKRLQKMSTGLVQFARVRKEEIQLVPIHSLIDEAWSLVRIEAKAKTTRYLNLSDDKIRVAGDPDRLIQLFVNLLRNAVQSIQPGGHIWVRTRTEEQPDGDQIVVVVEDDGPGIPESVLPEIFEAFITSRLDSRGTGLGLTVAEGIAHQHHGAIAAKNRPEGGAQLEVRLPVAPDFEAGSKASSRATEGYEHEHPSQTGGRDRRP